MQKTPESIVLREYSSPAGVLLLGSFQDRLCLCDWKYRKMRSAIDNRIQKHLKASFTEGNSSVLDTTVLQLEEYFSNRRQDFEIPLLPAGSGFQMTVWEELMKVPYGQCASYRDLAERIGRKEAVRAVAAANGANSISIIIPCHRIIGSNGELTGYAGGLQAKEKLLQLEQGESLQYRLFS
ncbi:MAG: methylated-DNA--[protein]-cysteine S-methyltransferase [Spirochaetales bacterium]|nr:methylated-DNA--[protein]-cysteine S-methyltransferase [Spirochaetales bacterium]